MVSDALAKRFDFILFTDNFNCYVSKQTTNM